MYPLCFQVNQVHLLGNSVKSSYPAERSMVETELLAVDGIWQRVKDSAGDRRNRLQEAVGQQIFFNSAKVGIALISQYLWHIILREKGLILFCYVKVYSEQ